ncbi:MAG TPA: hypothetical protein VGX28_08650 [Frankiaceae bacterium]|jgi:ABC-type amino acid transport substrate-binding protein|nr:hypothetical protein [Frankiaceae bacterium]
MRTRTALAAATAAALAIPGAATAAPRPAAKPKPLCNLVTDPSGDVATGAKATDIVGGDIVSVDGRKVTVLIRLAKAAAPGGDTGTPTGGFYQFQFTHNGVGVTLSAHVTQAGTSFSPGKATGSYDVATNSLTITASPGDFPGGPVFKKGELLTDLVIRTDVGNPTVPIGTTLHIAGDTAQGTKPYPVGASSCVRQG